jgi:V/A-type H+/Na+-transporting ATPase subunit C
MTGYEYGNARLRAMRSRLLTRQEMLQLAGAGSLGEMMGFLAKTTYRRSLEAALIQTNMLDSIFEGLRRDYIEVVGKIRGFYGGSERTLVDLILSAYDVHNLKTVLRGLAHRSSRAEIESALLPVGQLSATVFSEMLRAANPREAVDTLATIGHPFAEPLLILRAERPGADVSAMELALDRWHFQQAVGAAQGGESGRSLFLSALYLEVDILNLMTVLRFAAVPAEQKILEAQLGTSNLKSVFAGFGSITLERLIRVYQAKTLKSAVGMLAETVYAPVLREGVQVFEQSGRLSAVERSLRKYQLRWLSWQIAKDPLGIGVVLGFMALKTNEIANLRRIARAIQLKQSPAAVQAALEFVQ